VTDLVICVNSRIGSPAHTHSKVISALTKDLNKGSKNFTLNSSKIWLLCPTGKVSSVVSKVNPKTSKPAGISSGHTHGTNSYSDFSSAAGSASAAGS
jgi:hypothetical protein